MGMRLGLGSDFRLTYGGALLEITIRVADLMLRELALSVGGGAAAVGWRGKRAIYRSRKR